MKELELLIHKESNSVFADWISKTYNNDKKKGELLEYQFKVLPIKLSCLYEDGLYAFAVKVKGNEKDFRLQFNLNLHNLKQMPDYSIKTIIDETSNRISVRYLNDLYKEEEVMSFLLAEYEKSQLLSIPSSSNSPNKRGGL